MGVSREGRLEIAEGAAAGAGFVGHEGLVEAGLGVPDFVVAAGVEGEAARFVGEEELEGFELAEAALFAAIAHGVAEVVFVLGEVDARV